MSSATPAPGRHSSLANCINTAFGGDCANPATVPASFHEHRGRESSSFDALSVT
jgi:hypothetical protein